MKNEKFSKWLINSGSSEVTTKKYISAIKNISNSMIDINLINKSLFDVFSELELIFMVDRISNNKEFINKNKKGHNMYSAALNKFVEFKKDNTVQEEIPITQEDFIFFEGREVLQKHVIRERNINLIKTAKQKFKKEHGDKLFCEACGFNFYNFYGEIGEDYIEAHHSKPLSEIKFGEATKLDDIVMLCSNCHSMVHRKRPWLTKNEIYQLTGKKRAK